MLSHTDRGELLGLLAAIAADASEVLLQGYRRPGGPRVEYKGEIDLVTEFDRASESVIRARCLRDLPEIDLVAEEEGGTIRGDRPVLFADPLDGTTNFAHGHPFFAVSLGIVCNGVPEVGVVIAPALGWTFTAARGHGATRNDEPCRVSSTDTIDRALLATGFPYDRRTSDENNFRAFIELKRRAQGIRRCGAASLDLCLVADGTYDGYWERKLKPWDLAGGAAIVREAGGVVTDLAGGEADLLAGHLVAANPRIHPALIEALTAVSTLPPL